MTRIDGDEALRLADELASQAGSERDRRDAQRAADTLRSRGVIDRAGRFALDHRRDLFRACRAWMDAAPDAGESARRADLVNGLVVALDLCRELDDARKRGGS